MHNLLTGAVQNVPFYGIEFGPQIASPPLHRPQATAHERPFICPVATCLPVRDPPTTIYYPVVGGGCATAPCEQTVLIFLSRPLCVAYKTSSSWQIKFSTVSQHVHGQTSSPTDIQWEPAPIRMASSPSTFVSSICCRNRVEVSRELLSKLKA